MIVITPAKWLPYLKQKLGKILYLYEPFSIWVKLGPGILKHFHELCVKNLPFLISGVEIPVQNDCDKKVEENERYQDQVGAEICVSYVIVTTGNWLTSCMIVFPLKFFFTIVEVTLRLP